MKTKRNEDTITSESSGIALEVSPGIRANGSLIVWLLIALCVTATVFFFAFILPAKSAAENAGKLAGESSGQIAGRAVGAFEGAAHGIPEGYHEGVNAGLSADDTVVAIANTIEQNVNGLGNLEVLVANVDLTAYHEEGKKYGALYLTRGSAIFSIDLNEAKVTYSEREGLISIVLPQPSVEVTIDPSETERIAEWERKFFNGTDGEGFQAYLNTFRTFGSQTGDAIENYSTLLELASSSAIKQVEELAIAVRGNTSVVVTVSMKSN